MLRQTRCAGQRLSYTFSLSSENILVPSRCSATHRLSVRLSVRLSPTRKMSKLQGCATAQLREQFEPEEFDRALNVLMFD